MHAGNGESYAHWIPCRSSRGKKCVEKLKGYDPLFIEADGYRGQVESMLPRLQAVVVG